MSFGGVQGLVQIRLAQTFDFVSNPLFPSQICFRAAPPTRRMDAPLHELRRYPEPSPLVFHDFKLIANLIKRGFYEIAASWGRLYMSLVLKKRREHRALGKNLEMTEMMKRNCSAEQSHKHGGLSTMQEFIEQMGHPKPGRPLAKFAHSASKIVTEP